MIDLTPHSLILLMSANTGNPTEEAFLGLGVSPLLIPNLMRMGIIPMPCVTETLPQLLQLPFDPIAVLFHYVYCNYL